LFNDDVYKVGLCFNAVMMMESRDLVLRSPLNLRIEVSVTSLLFSWDIGYHKEMS